MIDPIDDIADGTIAHFKQTVKNGGEIDVKPILQGFSMDAILKTAFGLQTKCHKGENADLMALTQQLLTGFAPTGYIEDFFFQFFFHFPELAPGGFWNEAALKFAKMTKDVCKERDAQNLHVGDFIDTLRKMKQDAKPPISDDMINAQGKL